MSETGEQIYSLLGHLRKLGSSCWIGACLFEPGEVVPMLKSQELVQGLGYLEGPLWDDFGPSGKTEPAKYAQKWMGPKWALET